MKFFILFLMAQFAVISPRPAILSSPTGAESIVGKWHTADKQGIVQIYQQQGHFFGKLIGGDPKRLDAKNPAESLRQRPLLGTVILQRCTFDGTGSWEDGTIYDPNNGKTYSCTLKLRNANTLELRGYIGFSLLGRTEVWTRLP
jgi:uncharacterized protein (DUF2147 family)